jgi:hypothetical protein
MKTRRGQGILEFALILPVLLLIILGIVEAAFLIQGYLAVQHAAREAARFAVIYQPNRGACLGDDDSAPYPLCPQDSPESEPDYYARRVELIKREARRAASGLRIDDAHLGYTPQDFEAYWEESAFFGVSVWGYPSFQVDCNAYDPWDSDNPCLDHPGLEGLPVQVLVVHNVEIVDPFYRTIREYVPVRAHAELINEGVQAGFGDVVPPDFDTDPNFGETPIPTSTSEPVTPTLTPTLTPTQTLTPTASPTPILYFIVLSEDATNEIPADRDHEFVATVTDAADQQVPGMQVSFSTDEGGFSYSGTGPKYAEQVTDDLGQASVTLFGNQPGTATVRAWLDLDGDDNWDAGEPTDTANKTWNVSGPYITVSDHEVIPQQYVNAHVMDHDPDHDPYRLLWCVVSGASITRTVVNNLYVNDGGDATDLGVEVPEDSQGLYRLETHSAGSDCGSADLVAHSANIRVLVPDPDLTVSISGEVRVLINGIPWTLGGVHVWAYNNLSGEVYHTSTDIDGTYGFSNIPPGTYTIYSEIWVGAWLRFATTTIVAYDDVDGVNLLLL